jgi:hypothetical protein
VRLLFQVFTNARLIGKSIKEKRVPLVAAVLQASPRCFLV